MSRSRKSHLKRAALAVVLFASAMAAAHAGGGSEPRPDPTPVTYRTESRAFTIPQHSQSVTVWVSSPATSGRRSAGSFRVQWKVTGTVVARKASNQSYWTYDRMLHSQWYRTWENYEHVGQWSGSVLTASGQKHVTAQLHVYGEIGISVEGVGWNFVLGHYYPNVAITGSDHSVGQAAVANLW